jgi:hypothetical protein
MKPICQKCKKPFKEGDQIKAVVLSVFHEIDSSVSYAIEKPYECLSLEHLNCDEGD